MDAPAAGWQRIEGTLVLAAAVTAYAALGAPLQVWPALLLFLLPDLSMLGYAAGPRVGAGVYNLVHLYGWGASLASASILLACPELAAAGSLWIAHVGLDRMLGYGLKLPQGFAHTHLGPIGAGQKSDS